MYSDNHIFQVVCQTLRIVMPKLDYGRSSLVYLISVLDSVPVEIPATASVYVI